MFEIHYGIGPIRDFLTQPIYGWIGWVCGEGLVVTGVGKSAVDSDGHDTRSQVCPPLCED